VVQGSINDNYLKKKKLRRVGLISKEQPYLHTHEGQDIFETSHVFFHVCDDLKISRVQKDWNISRLAHELVVKIED
jgi:hypothetical protein